MQTSEQGIEGLKNLENLSLTTYDDKNGHGTIGWGHKITGKESFLRTSGMVGLIITKDEAEQLLKDDISIAEECINTHVTTPLNQNQYDGLVWFIFNIGEEAFLNSHVYAYIQEKEFVKAMFWWALWDHVKNPVTQDLEVSPGLDNRRRAEIEMFHAEIEMFN